MPTTSFAKYDIKEGLAETLCKIKYVKHFFVFEYKITV